MTEKENKENRNWTQKQICEFIIIPIKRGQEKGIHYSRF